MVVRDDADNLLPNIAVVFTIKAGDASFVDTNGAQATAILNNFNPNTINPNTTNPSKPAQRTTLYTDKNGFVVLRPQVGNTEGLIRINAYAEQIIKTYSTPGMQNAGSGSNTPAAGTTVVNASFLIRAKAAQCGPASPLTSCTGQVFDEKSRPLAGIKFSIGRIPLVSTTESEGKFELSNIPQAESTFSLMAAPTTPTKIPPRLNTPAAL